MHEIKLVAAEEQTTLSALVEQALRWFLAQRRQRRARPRVPLPSYRGWGLKPGVDLDSSAALLDLLDEDDYSSLHGD